MIKEKRPPINISELEGEEEHKPGPITYVRVEEKKRGIFALEKKAINFILPILISIILSLIIIIQYAPSKASVVDEVSRFETVVAGEIKGIQASSTGTEQQRIENLIQSVSELTERVKILEGK